jgi:hypothetical protein
MTPISSLNREEQNESLVYPLLVTSVYRDERGLCHLNN